MPSPPSYPTPRRMRLIALPPVATFRLHLRFIDSVIRRRLASSPARESPTLCDHMFAKLSVGWRLEVEIDECIWTPRKVQTCSGATYALMHPYDLSLIRALLQNSDEACPKSTSRPSLANTPGYKALLAARGDHHGGKPKRKLFAQRSSPKRKPKRRSQTEIKEQKDGPPIPVEVRLPAVVLDDGSQFNECTVQMLKRWKSTEGVWINASDDSICNAVQFVRAHGITVDMLLTKRVYKRAADPDAGARSDSSAGALDSAGEQGEGARQQGSGEL